jgi:uncharacterized repeat protein (TIGR03803 family)
VNVIASFNGSNGNQPDFDITLDNSGNIFGTTRTGGSENLGTIYEVAVGTSEITTLANFNGANGANPSGQLAIDGQGNLFGTTALGGPDYNTGGSSTGLGPLLSLIRAAVPLPCLNNLVSRQMRV